METDINRAVFGLLALAAGLVQWEERRERRGRTDLSACVRLTSSSSVWPCRLRSQSVFLRPENTANFQPRYLHLNAQVKLSQLYYQFDGIESTELNTQAIVFYRAAL